jgi:dTDP-glucose 4,6-dehydratase
MSTVFVLGANSFAGSVFVDAALTAGHDVLGINRSPEGLPMFLPYRSNPRVANYRFRQLDINHHLDDICNWMDDARPEYVVDFAGQGMVAESWSAPEQWYTTNIVSKVRLHDRLRRQSWLKKYVRVSTPEVYGSTAGMIPESQVYRPSTPYAVSHAAIDMSLAAFHANYGFPVVFTRFANFFGPGQQLYRIVPRTLIYGRTGQTLQLHGGGTSVRAFIHGRDVASGLLAALERGEPGGVYHFSTNRFLTIREAVEIMCRRMGLDFETAVRVAPDRPGKDQAYLMDSTHARESLGWADTVDFETGVDETLAWVDQNLDTIRTLGLDYVHKP